MRKPYNGARNGRGNEPQNYESLLEGATHLKREGFGTEVRRFGDTYDGILQDLDRKHTIINDLKKRFKETHGETRKFLDDALYSFQEGEITKGEYKKLIKRAKTGLRLVGKHATKIQEGRGEKTLEELLKKAAALLFLAGAVSYLGKPTITGATIGAVPSSGIIIALLISFISLYFLLR